MQSNFIETVTPYIIDWANSEILNYAVTIGGIIIAIVLKVKAKDWWDKINGR